jgi:hypothetical protein
VCRLYIFGPPASARFFAQNFVFPCTYYTTEWPLDVEFPMFLAICRRHYIISQPHLAVFSFLRTYDVRLLLS